MTNRSSCGILGVHQTDFAANLRKQNRDVGDLAAEAAIGVLEAAEVDPSEIESIHVGNAFGALYTGQAPHVRDAIVGAWNRAGIAGTEELDAIETHDCMTPSEYLAIDHFGITAPGQSWQAIEDGTIAHDGSLPVNPSGGLIGGGHPVGATGARMLADATKQVTDTAGEYQVEGARRVQTLNIGGSTASTVSFVVENT